MKLFDFLSPKRFDEAARGLYVSVVEQARQPAFYVLCGVPDTPDGRFDMIALHAFLVLRRLKRNRAQTAGLSQAFFDLMFADMDRNLREMGVGDLGVGKRVKAMAEGLYGRIGAYEKGLAGGDSVMTDALRRNLYRKADPSDAQVAAVAGYVRDEARRLDDVVLDDLTRGSVSFGPAPGPEDRP